MENNNIAFIEGGNDDTILVPLRTLMDVDMVGPDHTLSTETALPIAIVESSTERHQPRKGCSEDAKYLDIATIVQQSKERGGDIIFGGTDPGGNDNVYHNQDGRLARFMIKFEHTIGTPYLLTWMMTLLLQHLYRSKSNPYSLDYYCFEIK